MDKKIFLIIGLITLLAGCVKTPSINNLSENNTEINLTPEVPISNITEPNITNQNITEEIDENETEEINESVVLPENNNTIKPPVNHLTKIRDTITGSEDTLATHELWYKCRGACKFDCNNKELQYFREDVDENEECRCLCDEGEVFNIPGFQSIGLKIISISESANTIEIEYQDLRK